MEVVYGEVQDNLVFIYKAEAIDLARVHYALGSANTWGEFRLLEVIS